MNFVGEEMLKFHDELLKSNVPETLKELISKIIKPEEVKNTRKGNQADEYFELFDAGKGFLVGQDEVEFSDDDNLSESEVSISTNNEHTSSTSNDNVEPIATSAVKIEQPSSLSCNLKLLDQMNRVVSQVKLQQPSASLPH